MFRRGLGDRLPVQKLALYLSAIRSIPTLYKPNAVQLLNQIGTHFGVFTFFSGACTLSAKFEGLLFIQFSFWCSSYVGGLLRHFRGISVTAVFGEAFSNYEKLSSQKNVLLELSGKMVSCSDHCGRMMRVIDPNIEYSVLYYGSDLQYLSELASCRSTRPTKNPPTVMFLGRLNPEMGIDYFISLIMSLDEITPQVSISSAGKKMLGFHLCDVLQQTLLVTSQSRCRQHLNVAMNCY